MILCKLQSVSIKLRKTRIINNSTSAEQLITPFFLSFSNNQKRIGKEIAGWDGMEKWESGGDRREERRRTPNRAAAGGRGKAKAKAKGIQD